MRKIDNIVVVLGHAPEDPDPLFIEENLDSRFRGNDKKCFFVDFYKAIAKIWKLQ